MSNKKKAELYSSDCTIRKNRSNRLWNKSFVQLMFIEASLQMGIYATNPILSNYAVALGASVALAGSIAGIHAIASLTARPISGLLSDRLDKKDLLILSSILFVISAIGSALVQSFFFLVLMRVIQGFAFAFKSAVTISLVSLIAPKGKVGSGVGWIGVAFAVGCSTGPLIGSFAGSLFGYQTSFLVAVILFSLSLAFSLSFKAPSGTHTRRIMADTKPLHNKQRFGSVLSEHIALFYVPALPLALIAGIELSAQSIATTLILLMGEIRGIEGTAAYFSVYAFITLCSKPMAGKLSDKYGLPTIITPLAVCGSFGMVFLAFSYSIEPIVIGSVLMGVGHGSLYACLQAESVRNVPGSQVGRAANTFYLGRDIGMGMGPSMGGYILQATDPTVMFLAGAILLIATPALYFSLRRRERTRKGHS